MGLVSDRPSCSTVAHLAALHTRLLPPQFTITIVHYHYSSLSSTPCCPRTHPCPQAAIKGLSSREKQLLTSQTLQADLEAKQRNIRDLEVGLVCPRRLGLTCVRNTSSMVRSPLSTAFGTQ